MYRTVVWNQLMINNWKTNMWNNDVDSSAIQMLFTLIEEFFSPVFWRKNSKTHNPFCEQRFPQCNIFMVKVGKEKFSAGVGSKLWAEKLDLTWPETDSII